MDGILQNMPKKNRSSQRSLNSKFVDIEKIRNTQLATGEIMPEKEDKEEASKSGSALDCIIIE